MKNEIKWKGYTIVRFVVARDMDGDAIVGEYDNLKEAQEAHTGDYVYYEYGAAEVINKDGDVNPAVYGATLKEATDKLKKLLP